MENVKTAVHKKGRFRSFVTRLKRNTSGLALTEFAFSLPIFMAFGLFGLEISNLAITNMHVSQAALTLADNASRLGQTNSGIVSPTITESDVVRSFRGLSLQTENLELLTRGRVILSSLEQNSDNNQLIRWQRCKGVRDVDSAYGPEGTNGTDDAEFTGMGRPGSEVSATFGTAVMFVEIEYEFEGLFGDVFLSPRVIRQNAAFNIRDDRNLSAGLGDDGGATALCSDNDDTFS